MTEYTRADYARAADAIRSKAALPVRIGLVLGSGLGALADALTDAVRIPYADIPGFPASTVHGHRGELALGLLEGQPVVVQCGRAHFYEGYSMAQVTFAVRVMRALGVETLILTNAAGGVNPAFAVGDVMLINDHINLLGMTGVNPLIGPNDEALGPRFVGMSQTYDRRLRAAARAAADDAGLTLHEGVYACISGPNFETPAEVRMLRTLGADAVGMSTAPEVLVARHGSMRALAFSGITNVAIDALDTALDASHEEVLDAGKIIVPRMTALLRGVLRTFDA